MVATRPEGNYRVGRGLLTATGLLFVIAIGGLALTGHTLVRFSSDEAAGPYPLWMPLASALIVLLLTRLVPPHLPAIDPLAGIDRRRLIREVWVLVGAALAFPALIVTATAAGVPRDAVYSSIKVLMFLVIPLLAFRMLRGDGPKARWRTRLDRTRILAPIVPVVAWIALARLGPLAPPASGRWPAIATASVLFAAMHIASHVHATTVAVDLATIVAVQGTFGVMQGYLWSRYRNIWAPIAIHIAVNLIYLDMLIS
ncbi:CPBP family intramembrane glutamic endopeptidase [Mycobacteroides chelonae]|uniref:CPBP family intramembrane glutamic endopeptidase n=1 Tax=Mycobacteroides chelonae TaxID=1774 RepID=UPI0012FFCEB1|nr:CPBP family intramembrane glutamic endopeptidase [Mycobacteroides chelonae]